MNQPVAIDVAVIGLGPAGACAARAAALAGKTVIGADRKKHAGAPVQCAEFVPLMLGNSIETAIDTMIQPITAMETFVEQQAPDQACNFHGRMIDRAEFDKSLCDQAEAAGARLQFGTAVDPSKTIDPATQTVALFIGETAYAPKIIIGADGPRSVMGQAIGLTNKDVLETRQITVALKHPHAATDIFLSDHYPGGYAWLFPKGDKANIGLGLDSNHRHHLKPLLEALHQRLIREGRVGEDIYHHTGGAIPAGGMIPPCGQLGDTPVLLTGDAAGLTNCITGAGIASAATSGQLAGEAAAQWLDGDAAALEDYAEELEDLLAPSLNRACQHRQKLKNLRKDHNPLPPSALRDSWIAYPQYWR
ncbi:MAG: NAD(P)/FAD-dependent oxidoreductase [bacterium]